MASVTRIDGASIARLAEAMDGAGRRYRLAGRQLDGQCPAHDDGQASMSATWVQPDPPHKAGRVLIKCHAGCDPAAITAALGMDPADLFDGPSDAGRSPGAARMPRATGRPSAASKPAARVPAPRGADPGAEHVHRFDYRAPESGHVYADAEGSVVGRVDRVRCLDPECPDLAEHGKAGKTFVARHADGTKGKPAGLDALLYRLPDVRAAIAAGRPVWLCEGEGDADAVSAAGECGTSAFGGAARKWRAAYSMALMGADVIVCADRDAAGYRRAAAVVVALAGAARSVRVVAAAIDRPGADVSDHLAAGLPLADMPQIDPGALADDAPEQKNGAEIPSEKNRARVFPTPPVGKSGDPPPTPPDVAESADDGGPDPLPASPAPRYMLPSSAGRWGYSTGDDGQDYAAERGVYREVGQREDKAWQWVEYLPYVFDRVSHRDGAGRRARLSYRLGTRLDAAPDERTLAGHLAVKTGEWAEPLGVPLSADPKVMQHVASAIFREADRSAPLTEAAPRWTPDGTLELPPDDCGPAGYGMRAGAESAARETWAELAAIAARHPKVALIGGAAVAGPYVAELRRQSFIVHSAGRDRRGKTTAHILSAAIYGDPEIIVRPWDTTPIGLSQLAGELGCLPPILDELGARRGPKGELQNIVFQFAQGARRTKGGRDGQSRQGAPWRGVLLSTGNLSLLANLTERGAIARTIEVPTPIVGTDDSVDDPAAAADAERIESLAAEAFGWPLEWIDAAWITPAVFGAMVTAAESDLGMPGGGTLRTIAKHLAAAVAGAAVLGQVTGGPGMRPAALAAAAELLAEMAVRLDEISAPPSERLGRAIAHAVISRPDAFPPLADLRSGDSSRRYRDGEGFRITEPPAMLPDSRAHVPPPGLAVDDIGVLCDALPKISADGGLDDHMTALRGLRDGGRLISGGEKPGQLRYRVRIAGQVAHAYVFRLGGMTADDDPEPAIAPDLAPGSAKAAEPAPAALTDDASLVGTVGTDQLATARPAETPENAVPTGVGTGKTGRHSNLPAETPKRSVPTCSPDRAESADVPAGSGAALDKLDRIGPKARRDAKPSGNDQKTPGSARRAADSAAADPAAGRHSTRPAETPANATPAYPLGPILLIDDDAAYLADGSAMSIPPGDDLADVLDLAAGLGLGLARLHKSGRDADPVVYLTPAACDRYGIPAAPPDVRSLALAEDHPAAIALRSAGWTLGPIRPSTQVYRQGQRGASVSLTLLGWLADAAPGLEALTDDDPSPASLARRLGAIAAGAYPIRWTAGVTSAALMTALRPPFRLRTDPESGDRRRERVRGSLAEPVAPSLYDAHANHPAARKRAAADECREESLIWTRPRELWTAAELAAPYAVTIDVNTQFLAAAASLPVGLSAPRPLTPAELDALNTALATPGAKIAPGVYVATVAGLGLDACLPCPLTETGDWPTGPIPLHAPTIRYALELGAAVAVSAGYVSDECGPYLDPWNRRLVAAYLAALASAGITPDMDPADYLAALGRMPAEYPDAAAVVSVVKALAKAGIGRMRQDPDGTRAAERATWRPDIRAEVISRARTDLHRKIMRTYALTGVAPLAVAHDAVCYASDDPSPASVIPAAFGGGPVPGAFRIGARPGWVKHSHTLPMAAALAHLDAGRNPAVRRTEEDGD